MWMMTVPLKLQKMTKKAPWTIVKIVNTALMNKNTSVLHLWQKQQCEWIVLLSRWFIHESDWSSFWSSTTVDARVWGKTETHISIRRERTLLRINIFILNFILLNANRIAGFSHSYQVNKTAQSETHTHTCTHTQDFFAGYSKAV